MTRIQVGQGTARPTARPARPRGNGGGITGNSPAALSCLLAVLAQSAPARRLAFVAAVGPHGERETLAIRRARSGECGLTAREAVEAFTVECNGAATLVDDLPGVRDLLSRLALLADARWSLVDGPDGRQAGATEVYDGA